MNKIKISIKDTLFMVDKMYSLNCNTLYIKNLATPIYIKFNHLSSPAIKFTGKTFIKNNIKKIYISYTNNLTEANEKSEIILIYGNDFVLSEINDYMSGEVITYTGAGSGAKTIDIDNISKNYNYLNVSLSAVYDINYTMENPHSVSISQLTNDACFPDVEQQQSMWIPNQNNFDINIKLYKERIKFTIVRLEMLIPKQLKFKINWKIY